MNNPQDIAIELRKFSFFSGFPENILQQFSVMAKPLSFKQGEKILTQGQENESLYFLRAGTLQIQVDGQKVSDLAEPGEVVGEMSIISHRPVAASVVALTDVETFQVSAAGLTGPNQERLQELLFRVYASILADRLTRTNDKAKKFEIANRELMTAQEKLKKMNQNLETEIARRSAEIVHKIMMLTENHLQPARLILSELILERPNIKLSNVLTSINEVVDFLKPITDLSNQTFKEHRHILLIDSNKKQQNIAKLALGGTGLMLTVVSNEDELVGHLESQFDLILCDVELRSLIKKLKESPCKDTPLVLLMNLEMQLYLEVLRSYPEVEYIVSRDINNRTFTVKNISTTVTKILNEDFWGLEKYLAWGVQVQEKRVADSTKRLENIEEMKAFFQGIGIRSVYLDRVHVVAEELLMNAIFDAPMDSSGKSLYNHLPRTTQINLSPQEAAHLRYASDGVLLAISVSDPFGGLNRDIIMKYLDSCYKGEAGSLNQDKGGAGRGLHMIIENSDLTIFNVHKSARTEIICLFNLEKSTEEQKPTFHLFYS